MERDHHSAAAAGHVDDVELRVDIHSFFLTVSIEQLNLRDKHIQDFMFKAYLCVLQGMTEVFCLNLHQDRFLLIAANVVLVDEIYVLLPILIL